MTKSIYLAKKSEFARAAGIAAATATNLFKPGHLLCAALVDNRVDMSHPDVLEYLQKRASVPKGASVRSKTPGGYTKNVKSREYVGAESNKPGASEKHQPPPLERKHSPEPTLGTSYDIKDYEHLTVRQVVMRYGNIDAFKRFVESAKQVADYKLKEISIQKTRGDLVDREEVRRRVFQIIDVAFTRLVSDVPSSVSKQIYALLPPGSVEVNEIEELIRGANSQGLKNCKHTVLNAKVLDNATGNRYASRQDAEC